MIRVHRHGRINFRLDFRLQTLGHLLGLRQHPEGIFTENLADVLLRMTASQEFFGDFRIISHTIKPLGPAGDTVEIGAQANVVHTGHPGHVFDVFPYEREKRFAPDATNTDLS